MELPDGYLEREAAYDDGYSHGYKDGFEAARERSAQSIVDALHSALDFNEVDDE